MAFQRAERRRVLLKVAVDGPSGSGKTFSSLRLARGLVGPTGRIAMIDTENGSGSLYAHLTDFDVMEIRAPFTVQKYIGALKDAVAGGYDALIIDSLTHEWDGEGGLLDQKLALDNRGGNSFTNWATISKQHKEFTAQLLQSPIHIIATMRSKMEYEVKKDSQGKSSPTKVGLAPVQRDGMEYEFTVVFDVTADHTAAVSKDRTGLFAGLCSTLTEDHGKMLRSWLESGAEALPEPPKPAPAPAPADAPRTAAPPAESRGDAAANGHTAPPPNTAAGQCPSCNAPAGKPHSRTCKAAAAPTPAPALAISEETRQRLLAETETELVKRGALPAVVEDPIGAHIADESAHKRLTATLESRWKRYADILEIAHADATVKRLGFFDQLFGRGWPTEPTLFDLQELVAIFDRELAKLTGTTPAAQEPSPFDDDEQPALALA